jgi:hypothetical protein
MHTLPRAPGAISGRPSISRLQIEELLRIRSEADETALFLIGLLDDRDADPDLEEEPDREDGGDDEAEEEDQNLGAASASTKSGLGRTRTAGLPAMASPHSRRRHERMRPASTSRQATSASKSPKVGRIAMQSDRPTRRKMLATIATAAAGASVAALPALADDADAELFAYEPRLLAAEAEIRTAADPQEKAERSYFAMRPARPQDDAKLPAWQEADATARVASGLGAAEQVSAAAEDRLQAIAEAALATRARTFAGFAFKLRLCDVCGGDTVAEALLDDLEAMGLPIELFD